MYNVLLVVQILVAVGIISFVLVQHGKGADAGATFGGGGSGASGSVFGSKGSANFLSKTTAILAVIFFLNSLALAWIVNHPETDMSSLVQSVSGGSSTVVTETVPTKTVGSDIPDAPGESAPEASTTDTGNTDATSDIPEAEGESTPAGSDVPDAATTESEPTSEATTSDVPEADTK